MMGKERKVTIEITPTGWTTTLNLNGKIFIEKHISTAYGSKCIEGDFEFEDDIPSDIWHELSGFSQYDIMLALRQQYTPE